VERVMTRLKLSRRKEEVGYALHAHAPCPTTVEEAYPGAEKGFL
jgi:hypothetical protein